VQLIRCRAAPHLYVTSFAWPTQAELTQRDFAAERGEAVVISTGAVDAKEEARSAQDRAAAEARNSHRCAPLHQCPVSVVSAADRGSFGGGCPAGRSGRPSEGCCC